MTALILMVSTLALLVGFLLLTRYEMRRGVRVFARARARLDTRTADVGRRIESGEAADVLVQSVRQVGERLAHDVAHVTLIAVRFVERTLTQAVRTLRARRAENAPKGVETPASPFASSMKDFGQELRSGRDTSTETPG